MNLDPENIRQFQKKILSWYAEHKRDLPWRRTRDPYAIFISEVMAQQTQLSRVIPKYLSWLKEFPNVEVLANASSRDVLTAWSGLGYNRRALYLQKAAGEIIRIYKGRFPRDAAALKKLSGVGEYTANAIICFAFDKQVALVDTNVRKVILTQIIRNSAGIADKDIRSIAGQLLPPGQAYEWNQALMDYAASELKREKIPLPKQSRFNTSDRYYRGQAIKLLIRYHKVDRQGLFDLLEKQKDFSYERFENIVKKLKKDKLIIEDAGGLTIL